MEKIIESYSEYVNKFENDRQLFTIRQNGEEIGVIKMKKDGIIKELIKGLQGHDIKIDDFYW